MCGVNYPFQSSAEIKERAELYFYCPLGVYNLLWGELYLYVYVYYTKYPYIYIYIYIYIPLLFCNNAGNVRITQHFGALAKPLLPWKSNKYYVFLSVGARVCVRACVCVSVRECPDAWAYMCARTCSLAYPARNVHAPYCTVIRGLSGSAIFSHSIS